MNWMLFHRTSYRNSRTRWRRKRTRTLWWSAWARLPTSTSTTSTSISYSRSTTSYHTYSTFWSLVSGWNLWKVGHVAFVLVNSIYLRTKCWINFFFNLKSIMKQKLWVFKITIYVFMLLKIFCYWTLCFKKAVLFIFLKRM